MIFTKVISTIKRFDLIKEGDSILVGVSGGYDSVTLLIILNALKRQYGLKLYVAHLDHMLRKDSSKDCLFVKSLAEKLKIPFITQRIDVKGSAKTGSIEEIARHTRLNFLFKTAKKYKIKKIALGHNQDDQAETVLMRVIRGSGLKGLCAILPKRRINNFVIIRPLIETSRQEIERFLRKKRMSVCFDRSNLSLAYFRNRIRRRLLPILEKDYNTNIKEILSNTAQSVGLDYDFLLKASKRAFIRSSSKENSKIKIGLKRFINFHPAIRHMVIRLSINELKGDTRRITFGHLNDIDDLIAKSPSGSQVHLPKGIRISKQKKYLLIRLIKP
jgi:tRNA(Ile)-lysidine synthase